jgi:hypothetical protein
MVSLDSGKGVLSYQLSSRRAIACRFSGQIGKVKGLNCADSRLYGLSTLDAPPLSDYEYYGIGRGPRVAPCEA